MKDSIGIDFGTTNTVMARCSTNGKIHAINFPHNEGAADTLRTALCFANGRKGLTAEAGHKAISQFIEDPWETRFLQSFKTFAASPQFTSTAIFTKRFSFEDLLETFLAAAFRYAGSQTDPLPTRVVMGRPVTFAGAQPDDKLGLRRYDTALKRLNVSQITYVYEPVAAAYFFARNLTKSSTVLVADFGGGTTDFSVVRFEYRVDKLTAKPLGHSGIAIAGDNLDYRIIDQVLLPRLGKGTAYKSMNGTFDLPRSPFTSFARWNQLSILKTSREFADLKKLQRHCIAGDQVQKFIDLVEENQGYPLYKAVSEAKMRLSSEHSTTLKFAPLGPDFSVEIKRIDFESWIADDLTRIAETLNDALVQAQVLAPDIERVFLTGGTSFVPAIRAMFMKRFGAARVESGSEFVSIANGLAMIAGEDNPEKWSAVV